MFIEDQGISSTEFRYVRIFSMSECSPIKRLSSNIYNPMLRHLWQQSENMHPRNECKNHFRFEMHLA